MSFHGARDACVAMDHGGHLAAIVSDQQQLVLERVLTEAGISVAWVGGHIKEQRWNWYTRMLDLHA